MKYYLVAGEASGDLHGSNLMKEIQKLDSQAEFRFWGGDLMQSAGGTLVSHYKERAFMGLTDVLKNIRKISGFLKMAKADILESKPDVFILIDNPGFNLRLAKFAKQNRFKVHYYIAPKAWAWNKKRVYDIQKYVEHLYCILPFETDFFGQYNIPCTYVGNPVVDAVSAFVPNLEWKQKHGLEKKIIAVLPGSRKNEIERILPVFLKIQGHFKEYDFVIAAAPNYHAEYFEKFDGINTVKIVYGETYSVLANSHAAIVASGTATLETALFHVPQVVCYKVSGITYFFGKLLVKLKWFGLVNLILNRGLLTELLQNKFNEKSLSYELSKILEGKERQRILEGYAELKSKLGGPGASANVASMVCEAR
ncbi:MAG: lipid-A-disaccharide synthase [Bacteroidetes bacterium]|nr:lipid-A-disaccharide synthase [Bacteroidota bacterium]